jgi:DnaJ family protein A protein 2
MPSLYETLGVEKTASQDEIRKAFLKLARTTHPDKGGDPEKFKEISRANEILSDEGKRAIYDRTGQIPGEDVNQPGPSFNPFSGGGFTFDLNSLFGMFGPNMNSQGRPNRRGVKAPSQQQDVPLDLKHFYFGHTFEINVNRQIFCKTCDGSGAKKKEACGSCRGQGFTIQIVQMGGMTMQTQGPCIACQGKGNKTIEECIECHSTGKLNETKRLEAKVVPGMKPGDTLIFPEACSEQQEFEKAGDIVIQLREKLSAWKRVGNDLQHLETTVKLSLAESLAGCTVKLENHPDYDEGLYVEIPAASFANDVYCINGFGMPIRDKYASYGDLYLKIEVEISPVERKLLATNVHLLSELVEKVRPKPTEEVDVEKGLYLYK